MTVFVLRSIRSEVVDNCSEKPGKNSQENFRGGAFFILANEKQCTMNIFQDTFSSNYLLRFTWKAVVWLNRGTGCSAD